MFVYLVHHGHAVNPGVDPQRPLSRHGRDQTQTLSGRAAARGVHPDVIWHSGKLRARQTADAYWRACNPLAEFSATRWMQPDDPPRLADLLQIETRDLMLVGHMPHLGPAAPSPDRYRAAGRVVPLERRGRGRADRDRLGRALASGGAARLAAVPSIGCLLGFGFRVSGFRLRALLRSALTSVARYRIQNISRSLNSVACWDQRPGSGVDGSWKYSYLMLSAQSPKPEARSL